MGSQLNLYQTRQSLHIYQVPAIFKNERFGEYSCKSNVSDKGICVQKKMNFNPKKV